MDTQNLKAFQAVAEKGSFSAAAAALHLTQPAVSKRIAVLENQLNCRLFDRIGRRISLTEAGRTLQPKAQGILQDVINAQRLIANLSENIGGELNLATSHHIGLHRLPTVLRQFTQQYPQVTLDLDFLDSEKAYDDVLQGKFELAVVTLSPTQNPMLLAQEVWLDPLHFVASPDHPLAHESSVELEQLSGYAAILPAINTYTTALVKSLFEQQGLSLRLTMATNYLETIKMMVSIGLGWSVLPTSMVDCQLAPLPIVDTQVTRKLGCIYHRERTLSGAAKAFIALLRQQLADVL